MKNLGEQWVEEINGKKHMLKAVLQPKQRSHLYGNNIHPCFKCFFQMDDYDCAYPLDKWVCDMQRGVIIKDLGVLNDDGCLPSPWGGYPKIMRVGSEGFCTYKIRFYLKNEEAYGFTLIEVIGDTRQQAIDAWNRRA